MSLNLTELVPRPGVGKVGKPVRVRSNFFEVTQFGTQNVHHYDVTIDPPSAPPVLYRRIWSAFETSHSRGVLKGVKPIFDGRKNIFSPKVLPLGEENAMQFETELQEQGSKRPGGIFKIRIKKVGEVNMQELQLFLNGQSACTSNCLTAIMVLDVLISSLTTQMYTTVGRSFYIPENKHPLPNGAEVWQGFYQSARPTAGKMMINIDVSATAFYESGRLPEIVTKILGRRNLDDLRRGILPRDLVKLTKILKTLRIQVIHRGEKKLKYKITKLTPASADQTTFKDSNGVELTVAEYFSKQYNQRLNFPFLPCVVVKKDIFLPMEVCEVLPGQRVMSKLNEKQTAEMIKFTCQKPHVRANKVQQGMSLLKYRENPYMQQFGVSVKNEMSVINARVLPTPKISYHATSKEAVFAPQGGAWNIVGKKVAQGATLGSWAVINFVSSVPAPAVQRFVREICSVFTEKGMNIVNRQPPIISADPQGNIDRTLKEAWLKAGNSAKANPQLILCIVPSMRVPLYGEIKRIADTVIGVATQCVMSKHVADAKNQYCANVCLKVNLKLGGMNSFLLPDQIPFIAQRPTIVFGADVTHPGAGDMNSPSIAALCGSMDARASRYASCIRIQRNRVEVINDLQSMISELLKSFYRSSGQKPERILFYRDGVSEGQFKQIKDYEVAAIHAACSTLEKGYKPTVTFVVAQKRHHARFFPIEQRDADRTGNCMPGTVVDTNIVHPFEFDFYLQSHAGLQGTSRPTHYQVLHDENRFTPDALQELTYRMCYIYGRATRAVSLIPAVYYADLIAARGRMHCKNSDWSEASVTSEMPLDADAQIASFAAVKPDLLKVMYFM